MSGGVHQLVLSEEQLSAAVAYGRNHHTTTVRFSAASVKDAGKITARKLEVWTGVDGGRWTDLGDLQPNGHLAHPHREGY